MASNDNGGSFAVGFIFGAIVGAAAALLLAPKKGEETRSDLMERSLAMRARAEEMAALARAQAQERAAVGVATARERIGPAYEGVREGVRERVTPVVEQVNARISRNNDGAASEPAGEQAQSENA